MKLFSFVAIFFCLGFVNLYSEPNSMHFRGAVESALSKNLVYDCSIYFNEHENPEATVFLRLHNRNGLHIDDNEFGLDHIDGLIIVELADASGKFVYDRTIDVVDFHIDGFRIEDESLKDDFYEDVSEAHIIYTISVGRPKAKEAFIRDIRTKIEKCSVKFISRIAFEKEIEESLESLGN